MTPRGLLGARHSSDRLPSGAEFAPEIGGGQGVGRALSRELESRTLHVPGPCADPATGYAGGTRLKSNCDGVYHFCTPEACSVARRLSAGGFRGGGSEHLCAAFNADEFHRCHLHLLHDGGHGALEHDDDRYRNTERKPGRH